MERENTTKYFIWVGILGILAVMGLGAWIYQVSNGLIVTGMRNVVSWGLYITLFMFFVGLSAGGLIVSSSATVFNIEAFKKVSKPAVLLSTVCIIIAALFIFVDIGKPARIFYLFLHPQLTSPLIWDLIVISLYFLVSAFYMYFMTRPNPDQKILAIMSRIALPVAVLVHSVTAWIFGLQIAKVSWHSALMAPIFVASALSSGLALLLIALYAMNKFGKYELDKKLFVTLAGLLAVFVAVDAFFIGCEILTAVYAGEATVMAAMGTLFSGSLAPFFWGQIILGLMIPFLILVFAKNREKQGWVLFASVLIVMGVLFKRIWLLFSSYIFPLVPGQLGVTLGEFKETADSILIPNIWAATGSYTPTIFEIMIAIGIISAGLLLFTIGFRMFLSTRTSKREVKAQSTFSA